MRKKAIKKTIEINGEKIVIKKMALRRYAEMVKAVASAQDAIRSLFEMGDINEKKIIVALPKMIQDSYPQLIEILSIATGLDEKVFDEDNDYYYGLAEVAVLLKTVFEVNDFAEIKKNIESMLSGLRSSQVDTKTNTKTTG